MRKLLLAALILTGLVAAALVYERLFVEKTLGPAAILALSMIGTLFLSLLISVLLLYTRYREIVVRLWMVAVSTFTSYFVLDVVAGVFLIQPLSPPLVPDLYRHHKLVPNSYSRLEQQDFSYIQRINNFGLRGQDVSLEKPRGGYRILMLGDSFTMGKGVNDDETFSLLLGQSLNQRLASCGGKSIEVLNAGVDSYAPILSFLQLKRDLQPLKPDMVVLNLDVSDLVQETAYRKEAVYGADREIVAVPQLPQKASLNARIRAWIDGHLVFTRALLFYTNEFFGYRDLTVRNVVARADYEVVAHTLAQDTDPREDQWRHLFESILKIKEYCDRNATEFLLSVYPRGHQVSEDEWVPGRHSFMPEDAVPSDRSLHKIQKFSTDNNVQLVDVFPAFRTYRGGKPLYFRHDAHWTRTGHEVMAQGLQDYLESRYLEGWCR